MLAASVEYFNSPMEGIPSIEPFAVVTAPAPLTINEPEILEPV
jgi:hypothetical protein